MRVACRRCSNRPDANVGSAFVASSGLVWRVGVWYTPGMNLRFLHAADLHLDTPFCGLSAADQSVAQALRDASLAAWDNLVNLAIARRVDLVLLAGDIYDGEDRGVRAQLRLRRGLEKLSTAGISTYIVHGNHDPLGGYSAIRDWPTSVHIFGSDQVQRLPVQRDGQQVATVYGISYGQPQMRDNLAQRFSREGSGGLHLGLLHCSVGTSAEHDTYSPCELADLRRAGLTYWALGHVHQRQVLCQSGFWAVYSGNTQGRSPKPTECGPKGVTIVDADCTGAILSASFEPVDAARFVQTELDIADMSDLPALRGALEERASQLRSEHAGRSLLLRAVLTGTGPVNADLRRQGTIPDLLAELRRDAEDLRPLLYWESIQDSTRAELELARIEGRGDFLAEVLKQAKTLGADNAALQAFIESKLAEIRKLPARWTADLPAPAQADLMDRATRLALEMLQEAAEES